MTSRWARRAYASRRSGWYPGRSRRWRALREHQAMRAAVEPCWRTTPEGRRGQVELTRAVGGLCPDPSTCRHARQEASR